MKTFWEKLRLVAKDGNLRKRILFVIFAMAIFRALAAIPIPAVDLDALALFLENNQFFGLLNVFSGGGLTNLSIMMLGVGPYITATIIMQLLTLIFPQLKEMYHEEGEAGRRKFMQYSRLLTIPLAVIQGFGLLSLLGSQGVLGALSPFDRTVSVIVVTAGALLLMWIGELINEYGIGNGVSLLIFAGIIANIPNTLSQIVFGYTASQIPLYAGFVILALLIIAGIVLVTEAERPIPVTYAKRVRGMKMYGGISTYLPIRLNQAGVIPIIFALSILFLPQTAINLLSTFASGSGFLTIVTNVLNKIFLNQWIYGSLYFILVFLFTYLYTAITFDPETTAENLQKSGAFIPGTRPGAKTAEYISKIITRLTTFGATFLGIIAVLPIIMQGIFNLPALAIGGTGLLIVIQVLLDFVKQINAQISMREY